MRPWCLKILWNNAIYEEVAVVMFILQADDLTQQEPPYMSAAQEMG